MKISVDYLENDIEFIDGYVNVIEIENKEYFYRIVNDFYNLDIKELSNNIKLFDNLNEINTLNKFNIILNYFNFDFELKKYNNDLIKYLINEINDKEKNEIIKQYNLLNQKINKTINQFELPLLINNDNDINNILKNAKITINNNTELLNNLLLLIDLENILNINRILIFINLKQYLNKVELEELYKYSIYNNIKIILIDSQCYKDILKYEYKYIIDSNLDEFMIRYN